MLLQFGDKGDNVKYLQYGLHILCYSSNGFDGEFGNGTLTAVKKFQSKYGLVSDGIVGDVTWNTLKNEITTIQSQLNKKGFNVGTVDGVAGAATYNSVISFQSKNGLTADGQVGPATWDVLFDTISGGNSYSRILKLTSPLMYGEDIRAVQNKLNSLGYNAGTADGYYGNDTRNAVINFQTARGIDIDGEVGPTTWNTLFNISISGGNGVTSNIRKIFIDPGHGGTDPGASGNGLYEKEVVLSIAKKVRNILISKGFEVELSRSTDQYVSLSDRAAQANAWDADLFVSIHCNSATSSSANGTECYTHPTANASTKSLSKNMSAALASKLGLTNRGHKESNFAVLRLSNMPAILIETAFINNANDANKLKTRENDFASAIANQIANTSIDNSNGGSSNGNTSAEYSRNLEVTSPLMYGEDIRAVQNKLNSLGFNCGTADGYYGNDTKNAVINLQNTFGITADGIVGPTTWKYLFETNASVSNILKVAGNIGLFENAEFTFTELNSKTPEVRLSLSPAIYVQGELSLTGSLSGSMTNNYINLSDEDYVQVFKENNQLLYLTKSDIYLMSQVVYAESKGEPYEGKVAVASVILNRALNTGFPNTIQGVVFQPRAFSCVVDGEINVEPTQECFDAVYDALSGNDPTGDAVFFYNPDIATCSWMKNVEKHNVISIGQHLFFTL